MVFSVEKCTIDFNGRFARFNDHRICRGSHAPRIPQARISKAVQRPEHENVPVHFQLIFAAAGVCAALFSFALAALARDEDRDMVLEGNGLVT